MHHDQAGRGAELNRKVTVADCVQTVLANALHAQGARHALTVQRIWGAGQSRRAQRQAVDPTPHVLHALSVPRKHLHIRQQMVTKADRLGHLQMGETRQDDFGVVRGHFDQGTLQLVEQARDQVNFVAQPKAHIGCHLVVAAAPGVQAFARVAHQLGQTGFDVQVHVFQIELPLEGASLDLGPDLRHTALNICPIGLAQNPLCMQHLGMGQGTSDVRLPQAFVKKDTGGVTLDQVTHGLGKKR